MRDPVDYQIVFRGRVMPNAAEFQELRYDFALPTFIHIFYDSVGESFFPSNQQTYPFHNLTSSFFCLMMWCRRLRLCGNGCQFPIKFTMVIYGGKAEPGAKRSGAIGSTLNKTQRWAYSSARLWHSTWTRSLRFASPPGSAYGCGASWGYPNRINQ